MHIPNIPALVVSIDLRVVLFGLHTVFGEDNDRESFTTMACRFAMNNSGVHSIVASKACFPNQDVVKGIHVFLRGLLVLTIDYGSSVGMHSSKMQHAFRCSIGQHIHSNVGLHFYFPAKGRLLAKFLAAEIVGMEGDESSCI